ncbi:hypothetical protein [Ferrovibrio sp.]|uniref:hypothetical protein n=1 Tax=Ferrovibrio sp. TaxID=1917215 RepID=UPI001B7A9740|nr:hypothetical protein [Ferrovibrio sp.]MBP7065499.1 hypothetical protein [Ferrovibrio sp.]
MALTPIDEAHALQIQAGVLGRKAGHAFENRITEFINNIKYPIRFPGSANGHLMTGEPAFTVLHYIASTYGHTEIQSALALSTGALATSEEGKRWLEVNGVPIARCKSDIIITLRFPGEGERTVGLSTKQCNNRTPTNAQLYFTTARGFSSLLIQNGIAVSDEAVRALRQFCGDPGFRPSDDPQKLIGRKTDPRRYFWEEISGAGRQEWESLLSSKQREITRLLLQKAYLNDPFQPDFLLHKTRSAPSWEQTEVAIYTIDELIAHSADYAGFVLRPYSVRKGSYKDPDGVTHLAPRFGIVQMQRGGQAQHPEQLQFNLEAGYFYKIKNSRPHVVCNRFG